MSKNKIRFFRADSLPIEAQVGDIYFIHTEVPTIYIYKGGENPWEAYAGKTGYGDVSFSDYATIEWVQQLVDLIWELLKEDSESEDGDVSVINVDALYTEIPDLLTANKTVVEAINELFNTEILVCIPITYTNLIALRNSNSMLVGRYYRITDYVTTTSMENTISAGHAFDLIVLATSSDCINENAYAVWHSGDSYFLNSNLSSWELKYCLDNNTSRFAWADSEGKGVIYYMKDEFGNEASYDFKNIRFQNANNSSNLSYYYTFSEVVDDIISDKSLNKTGRNCYSNIIRQYNVNEIAKLNRIIFVNRGSGYSCYGNEFGINCYNNTFTSNCTNNKFGNHCKLNIFGDNFQTNIFGNNCSNNVFNNYCYYNSFGNNCHDNKFGNYCDYNSFGNNCYENTIKGYCNSNSFANDCHKNTIDQYSYNNSFMNYCYNNSLGDHCYSNSFSNSCNSNSLGDNCSYNSFGNSCISIIFGSSSSALAHYYQYNHFSDGTQYILFYSNDTASSGTQVLNCFIQQGVRGSSSSLLSVTVSRNKKYQTSVGFKSSGTLSVYCTAT